MRASSAGDYFLLAERGGALVGFVCGTRAPDGPLTHESMAGAWRAFSLARADQSVPCWDQRMGLPLLRLLTDMCALLTRTVRSLA